jgi:peptidoglycan/LPS O-acetylase OafA/YrhL
MGAGMQSTHRFHALDSFRGICAVSVVILHMHIAGTFTDLPFFANSGIFVEFFFVLSGFVLTHTYGSREDLNFKNFFISRSFRLLPLHIFMLGVFIFLELLKLIAYKKGIQFNGAPFTGANTLSEILPNLFLLQSWTQWTSPLSFNYTSWSISVEYYMYMIFGAILLYSFAYRKIVWVIISTVSFALLYLEIDILTETSTRGLSCFFAGAISYGIFEKINKRNSLTFREMTALEAFSFAAMIVAVTLNFNHKGIFISLLFCVVVIIFSFDRGALSQFLQNSFFRFLGKLSYSIYLTHAAILFCVISAIIMAQKMTGASFSFMNGNMRVIDLGNVFINNILGLAILAAVIACSMFTHKYIEMVGQKYGKKLIARSIAQTQAATAAPG